MKLKTLTERTVAGKTVIVRVDYNVPLTRKGNKTTIADDTRIRLSLKTIRFLLEQKAKVILVSHLGRPKEVDSRYSLEPVANYLKLHERLPVTFVPALTGDVARQARANQQPGSILLLENLRFDSREKRCDLSLAKELALFTDVYINDAFSTAHRAHTSTTGIPEFLPAFAGFSLQKEVETLLELTQNPQKPLVVVLGGAKISDKVAAVTNLSKIADIVLVGGAVANSFLQAEGLEIHKSFIEDAPADLAKKNINYTMVAEQLIREHRTEKMLLSGYIPLPKIVYPIDVLAAPSLETTKANQVELINLTKDMADTPNDRNLLYLDIGPQTIHLYTEILKQAKTVFWNGPMGVWENPLFTEGTRRIGKAIGKVAHTIIGGGDTISAAHHLGLEKQFSYISGAGGASLEFLGGSQLPGLLPLYRK